jgi:hypothetical protein
MADFERLNDEPGLKRFLGIERFPDETSLAEWMRSIGESGAEALMRINRDFIEWATGRIVPGTLLQGGELEWFLASGHLGQGSRDCSELLPEQLGQCESLLSKYTSYLYADSGSSAGIYLNELRQQVSRFSVSYNKWTDGPEHCAKELPESQWSAEQIVRWRDGKEHRAQHAWLRYQPEGCEKAQLFAATRHQLAEGELFWRYALICCESGREQSPGLAIERHKLKGDRERQFSQVLMGMDFHHTLSTSLAANQVFYALGSLAHNLLQAIKLIHLPDHEQPIRIRTLLACAHTHPHHL